MARYVITWVSFRRMSCEKVLQGPLRAFRLLISGCLPLHGFKRHFFSTLVKDAHTQRLLA